MEELGENQVSKYSSGVNILIRLSGLWNDANTHSRAGRFADWNNDLDCVFRELARDIKPNDYKIKKEEYDKFDSKIIELGEFNDGGSKSFKAPSKEEILNRSKQYRILNDKELFLKRLENQIGKGTTWDDDDEDGL